MAIALAPQPDLVVTGIGSVLPPAAAPDDWFDYRAVLGERGYKYVPRAAQMLLAAAKDALADAGSPELTDPLRAGVVLGSNNCASRLHSMIDRAVLTGGVAALRPATAPYFSVNLFLSRVAIEHGLKGFSLALHSPRVAGLEAVEAGARAVRLGRAAWLVVGVTEDRLDPMEPGAPESEEGSVVLTVETAERAEARARPGYGRCAVRTFYLSPAAGPDQAADEMRLALAALGAGEPGALPARLLGDESPVAAMVADALGPEVERSSVGPGALGPVAAVAGLLRAGGPDSVVATATAVGTVAVAVVRPSAT